MVARENKDKAATEAADNEMKALLLFKSDMGGICTALHIPVADF